jgi:hypothetical protein
MIIFLEDHSCSKVEDTEFIYKVNGVGICIINYSSLFSDLDLINLISLVVEET